MGDAVPSALGISALWDFAGCLRQVCYTPFEHIFRAKSERPVVSRVLVDEPSENIVAMSEPARGLEA